MSNMSNPNGAKPSLKVVINKQKSKVLFAEANSHFVDILLTFLTLPLGKVVAILRKHYGDHAPAIGSLSSLYTGLHNLDITHFCVEGAKDMLLNPISSFQAECRGQYYVCPNVCCPKSQYSNISMYSGIAACECGRWLSREIRVGETVAGYDFGKVFTVNPLCFVITDDLRVAPVVTGIIQTLKTLGVTDIDGGELRCLSFGYNDIMDLLKFSLTSSTPLTDLIMKTTSMATKPETAGIFFPNIQKGDVKPKEMALKVCLQKSTNKFLFAEATDEFIVFLFSFLCIPVAGVEFLLGGNTCLKNMDNLYRSVADFIDSKYFTTPDIKNRIINPKLAHGYISDNQFLSLTQDTPPKLYYTTKWNGSRYETTFDEKKNGSLVYSYKSSKGNYVKNHTVCFVTDDLTVSPSLTTSISILNGLGIPLSDVEETELSVGMEEALRILKASLTSTSAVSTGLVNKLPKELRKPQHKSKTSTIGLVGQIR